VLVVCFGFSRDGGRGGKDFATYEGDVLSQINISILFP
jgi:hypothetical protein